MVLNDLACNCKNTSVMIIARVSTIHMMNNPLYALNLDFLQINRILWLFVEFVI